MYGNGFHHRNGGFLKNGLAVSRVRTAGTRSPDYSRGSSFLLQKDYKVHIPVVKELLNEKYDVLAGIDCIGFKDDSNQKLLQDINSFLEQYVE